MSIGTPFNAPTAKGRSRVIKIHDGTDVAARYFVYKLYEATDGQLMMALRLASRIDATAWPLSDIAATTSTKNARRRRCGPASTATPVSRRGSGAPRTAQRARGQLGLYGRPEG